MAVDREVLNRRVEDESDDGEVRERKGGENKEGNRAAVES
jgi:hypothetical protein